MSLSLQDRSPLSTTKTSIPHLGFGVYQLYGASCQAAVRAALAAGYRHFDTAQLYRNEADVGTAIQDAISAGEVKRDDVFLTTKIRAPAGSPEQTYASCADSIDKVGGKGGYVDLFLIHIPGTGRDSREELWKTLEKLHGEGRARAIGVSNYRPQHIDEMKEYATVWPPHVNQIELHPWCQQREITQYCKDNGVVLAAYSPLSCGDNLEDATLGKIADKHGKTPAQILIRFALQQGWVPLPKSGNAERIKKNADVFDFALDEDDIKTLDGLDKGKKGALFPGNTR